MSGTNRRLDGTRRRGTTERLLEASLWAVSVFCAAVLVSGAFEARAAMKTARGIIPAPHEQTERPQRVPAEGERNNPLPPGTPIVHGDGEVIGRLDIPKVKLSVPVLENFDPATLRRGVGHIPGTAMPGGLGNLGLAGHRDTFLRPVRNVRTGMEVDVVTSSGTYRYQVDSMEIVNPDQVEVLEIRGRPELTLITCYPFDFIGAAPQRFIVHAHLLSLDPG